MLFLVGIPTTRRISLPLRAYYENITKTLMRKENLAHKPTHTLLKF